MKRFPMSPDSPVPPLWENYPFQSAFIAVFEKGEYLCVQDQPVENLFLIQSGKVKTCITSPEGKNFLVNFYGKGILIGDIEGVLLSPNATSNVQAVTRTVCYGIAMIEFLEVAHQNLDLMNHLAILLAGRTRRIVRNAAVNILSTLEKRLCAYIKQMQHDGYFEENLTTLSDMLGTGYRNLHRTLRVLCEKGILQKKGRGYLILDMDTLSDLAGDMYRI